MSPTATAAPIFFPELGAGPQAILSIRVLA